MEPTSNQVFWIKQSIFHSDPAWIKKIKSYPILKGIRGWMTNPIQSTFLSVASAHIASYQTLHHAFVSK